MPEKTAPAAKPDTPPEVAPDEKAVREVLRNKSISTFFQPMVCVTTKSIIGFEAFSRGGSAGEGVVDTAVLFHDGLSAELKLGVDELCREKSLLQYKPIYDRHKEMLFFLNVNPDILEYEGGHAEMIKHQVASLDIAPSRVVIELPLRRALSDRNEAFIKLQKGFGFKVSLDNCGVDAPCNQAISRVRPDFIKVNRSFFAKDESRDYSLKALEVVQEVAARSGVVVAAQGVESEDDSLRLLSAGVHMQQGYYYTKDEAEKGGDPAKVFLQKIVASYDKFKKMRRELVRHRKERFDASFKIVSTFCSKLSGLSESRFDEACKTLVRNQEAVIAAFVMDERGEQLTARAFRPLGDKTRQEVVSRAPAFRKGVDHSVNDYVMYIDMGYERFVTHSSISSITGEPSCFITQAFYNSEGQRYIVCIELPHPG
jgi:EAL domain-containing protein (putative c-di-GMP-specific phosphodiesterase class I)